jgi:ribosome-associated toxin RatA of RatAB toxin-antitoxin module
MNWAAALTLFVLGAGLSAEPRVVESHVFNTVVAGKTWMTLSGTAEATTDLGPDRLLDVITDWTAYPRLFRTVRTADVVTDGDAVLLSETNVVTVFAFSVTNKFTLRVVVRRLDSGGAAVRWTQERTDGTIDNMQGGWDLEPVTFGGKPGTLIRYRTVSSVPQAVPGQDALVGLFFPGELKQIVASVLAEARLKKEKP